MLKISDFVLTALVCVVAVLGGPNRLLNAAPQWPQAAGPNHNFTVETDDSVPTKWSVERQENILWRTTLPETGQSGITIWEDMIFLTTMKELPENLDQGEPGNKLRRGGTDIVMHCFDANTGDQRWSKELSGASAAPSIYGYGSVSYTHLTLPTICSV